MNVRLVIVIFCFILCIIVILSCDKVSSCAELAEGRRDDYCDIIVDDFSTNEYRFYLKGKNALTGEINTFRRINYLWGSRFIDQIEKGDTVVKKKGELIFYIHKRDSVLTFPFKCAGEIFE